MKLKKYKKKTVGLYISREVIVIVLAILGALFVVNYLYQQFNSVVMPLAEAKARKYLMEIINKSSDDIKFDKDLFAITRGSDNTIEMINYNSYEATKLINEITYNIQDNFNLLEENNQIIFKIPSGVIFKNSMLRNLGPKIVVKLNIMGDVISELETEVKPYGINNALVEVRVKLVANARVILPLVSKEIQVSNNIPIAINIVSGKVPEGYIASYGKST